MGSHLHGTVLALCGLAASLTLARGASLPPAASLEWPATGQGDARAPGQGLDSLLDSLLGPDDASSTRAQSTPTLSRAVRTAGSPTYTQDGAGKTQEIKNRHGICLDASQRSSNGGKVHMWACNTGNANQQWNYNPTTGQIKNRHGICLDASQRSSNGGKVHMWACNTGNANQQWSLSLHTTSADGINVQSVKAQGGGAKAVYRRVFGDRWVEECVAPSGTRTFWFSEVRRDKWSVYLYDAGRNMWLQLDLYTKKVMLIKSYTVKAMVYHIVDAASSTCTTGGFSPRADGYYLIGADGLYWAQTGHGQPVRLASDSTGASAHWRFKKSSSRKGEWVIVNRQTGDAINVKKSSQVHYVMVAGGTPVSFESTCKGNQVKFAPPWGESNWVRCGCGQEQGPGALCAYTAGTTLVTDSLGPKQRFTGVGCGRSCPSGYYEIDSTDYFWCKSRRCASRGFIIPSPAIQDVDKYWDVAPVATFRKIGLVKMPVVKVIGNADEEAAMGMAKSVAGRRVDLVGGLIGITLPVVGAVGSALANFFIDNFFPGTSTSLEDKLDDLAKQILNVVDAKIDVAVVKEQVRKASNKFSEARSHFHKTYAREKRVDVKPGADVNTMEHLASELQGYSEDYESGLKTLSADHEKYDHRNRQAVQRAQGSWGLAKLASMELMLVYQERVALDAYISRTAALGGKAATAKSCQTIVNIIDLPTKVHDVTEQLRKTQTMLSDSICSTKPGQHLTAYNSLGNDKATVYNSECRFDVENLSYRYKEQAAALAAMVDQAMVTCHQIKAGNNAYLDSFINSRF